MLPILTKVTCVVVLLGFDLCNGFKIDKSLFYSNSEDVVITSDEPAILDSNITFSAKLLNPRRDSYTIEWRENFFNGRFETAELNKNNNFSNSVIWHYSSSSLPGTYAATCTIYYQSFITWTVTSETITFHLTKTFTGNLLLDQGKNSSKSPDILSTLNETRINADVHDPSGYLETAENVTYSWYVQDTLIANTSIPEYNYTFSKEGYFDVNVTIDALFLIANGSDNSSDVQEMHKYGNFYRKVRAIVPIVNFTIQGDTWYPHGQMLNITMYCNGTAPYSYCTKIKPAPYNVTENETCEHSVLTNDCVINLIRYFGSTGPHTLLVFIDNDISTFLNRTTVNVYKVTKKQPLSIIVVPITCSLIALVLIIFGIAYFWESHARFTIEVADFDFGKENEMPYMTFVERLKDAISPSRSSHQRLISDDEPSHSHNRIGSNSY